MSSSSYQLPFWPLLQLFGKIEVKIKIGAHFDHFTFLSLIAKTWPEKSVSATIQGLLNQLL